MNNPPLFLFVLLFFVEFLPVNAQVNSHPGRRAMFEKKAADGLEIKILKKNGSRFEIVSPDYEFRAGDEIRFNFRSNFDGHVYFVNVAPNGETRVVHHSVVKADKENELPTNDSITFDKEVGVEVLKIVLTRDAIPVFDDAIRDAKGFLGKDPDSVAEELRTRSLLPPPEKKKPEKQKEKTEALGIVQSSNEAGASCRGLRLATGSNLKCRGLVLALGNPQNNQGTIAIAIPDDPKAKDGDGKLKSGEVMVIDLYLKHVQ